MNKKQFIQEKFIESLWNKRGFELSNQIFTSDFITNSLGFNKVDWEMTHGIGPSSMIHHIKDWLLKIPDARMTIKYIYEDANSVSANWQLIGTFAGEILGVKPTSRIVTINGCTIFHFRNIQIRLNETLVDTHGFLAQIGATEN